MPLQSDEVTARAETSPDSGVATPAAGQRPKSRDIDLPVVVGNRYKLLGNKEVKVIDNGESFTVSIPLLEN